MAQIVINTNVEPDLIIIRKDGETIGNRFVSKLGNIVSFLADQDCLSHVYNIIVSKTGYSDATTTFTLSACGDNPTVTASTNCVDGVGTITYNVGPTGVGNFIVQLKSSDGTSIGSPVTRAAGDYNFSDLSAGTYIIEVKKELALNCSISITRVISCSLPGITISVTSSSC